jgi:hypothetical protein
MERELFRLFRMVAIMVMDQTKFTCGEFETDELGYKLRGAYAPVKLN